MGQVRFSKKGRLL